jgi:hypothetical protein
MKNLLVSVALLLISSTAFAQLCPGRCTNTSGNSFYDGVCTGAGQARGQAGCNQYLNLGCVWTEQRAITYPGSCVNQSGNSFYDGVCTGAGQARGQAGCNQYLNLGCTWFPERTVCQ